MENAKLKLTDVERDVLGRIARGERPWRNDGRTPHVSKAIFRLKTKGAIKGLFPYHLTDAGRAAIASPAPVHQGEP